MGIKAYVGCAMWAIVVWVAGILILYAILYLDWGAEFWHPLR
jgi:hypothetical protein